MIAIKARRDSFDPIEILNAVTATLESSALMINPLPEHGTFAEFIDAQLKQINDYNTMAPEFRETIDKSKFDLIFVSAMTVLHQTLRKEATELHPT